MNIGSLPDMTLRCILKRVPRGLLPLLCEVSKLWRRSAKFIHFFSGLSLDSPAMSLDCLADETLLSILRRAPKGLLPLYMQVNRRWARLIRAYLDSAGWPSKHDTHATRYLSRALFDLSGASKRKFCVNDTLRQPECAVILSQNNASEADTMHMLRCDDRKDLAYNLRHAHYSQGINVPWLKRMRSRIGLREHLWRRNPSFEFAGSWRDIEREFGLTLHPLRRRVFQIAADDVSVVPDMAVEHRVLRHVMSSGAWRILQRLFEIVPDDLKGKYRTTLMHQAVYQRPHHTAPRLPPTRSVWTVLLENGIVPSSSTDKPWAITTWRELWLWQDAHPEGILSPVHMQAVLDVLTNTCAVPEVADLERCAAYGLTLSGQAVFTYVSFPETGANGVTDWILAWLEAEGSSTGVFDNRIAIGIDGMLHHPQRGLRSIVPLAIALGVDAWVPERCFSALVRANRERLRVIVAANSP